MPGWAIKIYSKLGMHRAGVKKHFLIMNNDDQEVKFYYVEKGNQRAGQSSLVFIHGFSSNKRTWLPVIRFIPDSYHCIAVDLPNHGESVGFNEKFHLADHVIDLLKQFIDQMNFLEPICLIGGSMGGSLAAMFARKYPLNIGMICLLSPPPGEKYETDMIQQLRSGTYHLILPETFEQLHSAVELLSTKKIHLSRSLAKKYLKTHLKTIDQQKRILQTAFQYDYPNLSQIYEDLKYLTCPTLILWGQEDRLCHPDGAEYMSRLLPKSELILFKDCGHLITTDKPEETAAALTDFLVRHPFYESRL